jgi:hypothetical protein
MLVFLTGMKSRDNLRVVVYAGIVLWINLYVCRDWFSSPTAYHFAMHGFWTALSRLGEGWFHPAWWPFWDCGIPFEFTYAPLVPALTALMAAWRGVPHLLAFQSVSAIFYCLVPLTLFLMAWRLTRAAGYSFAAAVFYSLVSPTEMLAPDRNFAWASCRMARRLFLQAAADETPHYAALAFLPVTILLLTLVIERRRAVYGVAAAVSIALASLASGWGVVATVAAAVCLLSVLRREAWRSNAVLITGIGVAAYALAAPNLAPSLIQAIFTAAVAKDPGLWTLRSITGFAVAVLGGTIVWHCLTRWTKDWHLQFFVLYAYVMSSIPLVAVWLHRGFLPQPDRCRVEIDMALTLAIVLASRCWIERLPLAARIALACLLFSLAAGEVVSHRRFAKDLFYPQDVTRTIECRTAQWASRNLDGVRVAMPGAISLWADAFAAVPQLGGGLASTAYNQVEQRALDAVYSSPDAQIALAWMRAFGVGAVVMAGPSAKFDGVLQPVWREEDVTIYRVPQRNLSLAHVVPEAALVRRQPWQADDVADLERFDAAVEDPALPEASFQWDGRNRMRISTVTAPGQVISVQVSYHPGWHARINGQPAEVQRDGLGLIWLRPGGAGACYLEMVYDGGWELRLLRYARVAALLALAATLASRRLARAKRRA